MSIEFILAISLTVIILIISLILTRFEKRRKEKLKKFALTKGYRFYDEDTMVGVQRHLNDFFLFTYGHAHKVFNIIQCDHEDIKFNFFDCSFYVGSGRLQISHRQSVIYFHSSNKNFPQFTLTPKHWGDKIQAVFGGQDMDFKSNKIFPSLYRLRSSNEKEIRNTFNDRILDYFSKNKELFTEANNNKLIFYKRDQNVKPEEIPSFIEEGKKVLRLFTELY